MVVAGVGGLLLGHILWVVLISLATGSSSAGAWVLVVAALVAIAAAVCWRRAWGLRARKDLVWAAFLGALPVSPVIFTVVALGQTYL